MAILMKPIAYIKSNYKTLDDIPRQSVQSLSQHAEIQMLDEFAEGIKDLEAGRHIVVLFYFHKSKGFEIKKKSKKTGEVRGIFSLRSPHRPNGIGMSIVKIIENECGVIKFQGVDMLDGTPVLDIKPYEPALNPEL